MKCPKCASDIREGSKFCTKCGAAASVNLCPQCKNACNLADRYCNRCGYEFSQEKMAPAAAPKPLEPKSEESVRKHVTILVADIKDSEGHIRSLDPEELKETIYPILQKLGSLVYEYGGVVVSMAGDSLTASFGAPQVLEDHALRACLASLAMQKQIKAINEAFTLRIGLDSGEILLTVEGAKYSITGAAAHLAVRIGQAADSGTIRLTQNTFKLAANNIVAKNLGPLEIKGLGGLIETFELKGVKVGKSLYEWTNQFLDRTSFVNREKEIAKVSSLLSSAKKGPGSAVSLCADVGLGKSRFVYEIINTDLAKDCNILLTSAFTHTKDIPLLPIKNLFLYLFGILLNESDIEKIKKQIEPFLAQVKTPQAMNGILSLINFSSSQPEWVSLEPGLKRKYMFEAGVQVLLSYSLEKPLILIFEDMHWADRETEIFLDALLSQIPKFKVFAIFTYRPQYRDHWSNKPGYVQVVFEPLPQAAGMAILDNLLGIDPSLAEIKAKLLLTVGGNPFFLEELTLSLVAEKVFIGEKKKYRLREGTVVGELHLPETIATAIQSKIDTLPPLEKKLLQIASVIGIKFLYSQLIQLMEVIDEAEVRSALNRLCSKQYIYEAQLYPEPGFTFMYTLTCEIAYDGMLKKTRKELHLKTFQILEKTLQEDRVDQIQIVAEHAYLGENWAKAFGYCAKGAKKVAEINAFTSCAKLYENALSAAKYLPQDEALTDQLMLIHYTLYYIYVPLGRFNEQYEHLEKALALALAKKNRFFESIINSAFCIHIMGYKDIREGLQYAEKAYQIGKELQSVDAIAISQFAQVNAYAFLGQFQQLFTANQELEKTLGGNLDFRSKWFTLPMGQIARCYDCWARAITGDFAGVEARKDKWFAESKNLKEATPSNVCRFGGMGMNYYLKGDYEKSLEYTSICLQHSLNAEFLIFVPLALGLLAHTLLRLNKIAEGKEYMNRTIAVIEKLQGNYIALISTLAVSESMLLLGEYERVKEYCGRSMQAAKERHIEMAHILLARVSAEVELHLPNPNYPQIKQKIEEVEKTLEKFGMHTYRMRFRIALAEVYKKMGEEEKSKNILKDSLAYFEQKGMPYWIAYTKGLLIKDNLQAS